MGRVRYLILIYSNPRSRAIWGEMSVDERAEGMKLYDALTAELAASGEMVVSQALADPSDGKRVKAGETGTMTTDGPFAEVKEHLAGFFLLDCEGMDRAVEIAGRVPEAWLGLVEVRPVRDRQELVRLEG
jgi:hypothetical protein